MMFFVVFAGQSNAFGHGMSLATLPAALAQFDYGATYIWNGAYGSANWGQIDPGHNTGDVSAPQAWGPEVQFAHDFRVAHPGGDVLLIVKSAFGSTGLAADPAAADWSPASGPADLFDFTTATIERARRGFERAQGYEAPRPDAVFLDQGEEDALDPAKAAAYHANLTDFIAHARADWLHDPAGKVIAARIGGALPYSQAVRVAQWQADQDDPALATFKTIGFGLQPDGVHLDAAGHVSTGAMDYRLFDEWF